MKTYLWRVSLAKYGKKKIWKELDFIGSNLLEISHLAWDKVYGNMDDEEDEGMFDIPTQIVGINRIMTVKDIVNGESYGDGEISDSRPHFDVDAPYELFESDNVPNSMKVKLKCTCGNFQELALIPFEFTRCHDCDRVIFRKDIKNMSGIWVFSPSN